MRRESGNWKDGEPGSGRAREEIVEDTVTSPEEVPEPFPEETKQPDIIMFEQAGGQVRFVHRVYREEETERLRIETLRTNRGIAQIAVKISFATVTPGCQTQEPQIREHGRITESHAT